ncbi:MAG: RNA-directed DNA polymerase [Deltaproteobacteria bacterium]|nr:RNA-directed DNA polymerase [Deltaproteobacteria bacterium]
MKRTGNLYLKIAAPDNLRLAFCKAARGKQDRVEVMTFRNHFEPNIMALRQEILDQRVKLGDYRFFYVHDPKKRLICAACFRERVLHHAIMNVCEQTLDAYAIFDSYACRKGKGGRKAISRAEMFSGRFLWYLKLDIAKYFNSIDHEILMRQLERRFKDRDLLDLFRSILNTYATQPGKGVPIGNLFSQHMANFYLGRLDHWTKEVRSIRGYVRYMDDFVLWGADRKMLKEELSGIEHWLHEHLRLKLNPKIQLNRCARGMPFLGYFIYPGKIRLSSSSRKRFIRKFRNHEKAFLTGEWTEDTLSVHVTPLVEFTRSAESAGFRTNVISRFGSVDHQTSGFSPKARTA